jgi:hypothetical protein
MNIIGTRTPVDAKSLCNSRPLILGNRIQACPLRQFAGFEELLSRKNVSAAKPADRIRAFRARQIPGSSSPIETKDSPHGFCI